MRPDFRFSGLMLDSARCLERRGYYKRVVDFAAGRGINTLLWHFTDDQGCTLAFDSVQGIASPHAYSKPQMKRLVAYARARGVVVVPELATLGHCRYLTRLPQFRHLDEIEHVFTGICPVAPETREVLSRLLGEVAEVFDSPWIHVGLDEANIGHHPLTRAALQTRAKSDLVAEHVQWLHAEVTRLGRRTMVWGDGLLKDRAIAPRLPRDIVVCDWQYAPQVSGESTQYFLDLGFDVVLCPALVSHQQPALPGDQYALANVRSVLKQRTRTGDGKVVGVIETIWQPERYMHDALWIGMDLACGYLAHGPDLDVADRTRRFAGQFYGMAASEEWVGACLDMYRIAPLREEWLAVAKLDAASLPAAATLKQRAAAWRTIGRTLVAAAPAVRNNVRAYRTFVLLVRVFHHLYRKAVLLRTRRPSAAQLCAIAGREERLVRRVEAVWDRERYADDPKKTQPAREVMRDNHLIIVLRAAADLTRARLQDPAPATPPGVRASADHPPLPQRAATAP